MNHGKCGIWRMLIYSFGVMAVSLGIVLCKKCNLGISPVSSIPFVLEEMTGLSFGKMTMLFHMINTAIQLVLMKKVWDMKIYLQIPLGLVFGIVIDFFQRQVVFDGNYLVYQITALVLSIFFTALGMVCMLHMNLIQNPPDGVVKCFCDRTGLELGKGKIYYDCFCVMISMVLGIVFLKKIRGFGVATVLSAIFVGKTISWIRMVLEQVQRQVNSDKRMAALQNKNLK